MQTPPQEPRPYAGQPYAGQPYAAQPYAPKPFIEDRTLIRMVLPIDRSLWAIAAGYLGLFALLVFPAPLALLAGIMAVIDIRKNPRKHGMGRAVFGILAGAVGSVFLVLMFLR